MPGASAKKSVCWEIDYMQESSCQKDNLPPAGRKTCLQVAFLLAKLTKALLRYFRESNKACAWQRKKIREEGGSILKRTISFMTGKGSVNHNSRKFHAKNTDPERSQWNVVYCNENIQQVYHELFDEALARYNAKQTRSDRRIDDYYNKIVSGKQEKPFHEIIVQVGNVDNMGAKTENGQLAAKVLDAYMRNFQKRHSTFKVFGAYLHMDESTPHLHIDFVPFTTGSKRGLDTRVSLKQALSALGFKGGTRSDTEWNQWVAYEKEQLAEVMLQHGIEWEKKGTHEKHLSVLDFEKNERVKEVAELEKEIFVGKEELSEILNQQVNAEQEIEQIRCEGKKVQQEVAEFSARNTLLKEQKEKLDENNKKLLADKEKLENQQKKLLQEINRMAQSKESVERRCYIYDESIEWQLPEPGKLMSAKAYYDKKAQPLVKKLKEEAKALMFKCIQLVEEKKKLDTQVYVQGMQIKRLTNKIVMQKNNLDELQEIVLDLKHLERSLGREQIRAMIEQSKQKEQEERASRHRKRIFEMGR